MTRPVGERVAAVETSLMDHIKACERRHEWAFRTQLAVLAVVLTMLARAFQLV